MFILRLDNTHVKYYQVKKMLKKIFASVILMACLPFAASADSLSALFRQSNDPVAGDPKGKVTVVEFFDYQCSHCADMPPVTAEIIRTNPHVRFGFKDLPIRGPLSQYAAQAALAANRLGKYLAFNH